MENPIQETTDLFRFQITEEQEEERVDKCIAALIDSLSRSFIQKMIKEGRVCINGLPVKASYQVKAGDDLSFLLPKAQEPDIEPEDIPLDILYEDSDVLVVNKPKDMVVHPAAGHYSHTLVNAVLYHCRGQLSGINGVLRPGIVHRIDKDTTGSVIVCKNDAAHQALAVQFANHTITRRYRAIVHGVLTDDEGIIDAPIGRDNADRKKMAVNQVNGKRAVTHYTVLKRFERFTYRVPPGNGENAPDPCPHGVNRSSAFGRQRLWSEKMPVSKARRADAARNDPRLCPPADRRVYRNQCAAAGIFPETARSLISCRICIAEHAFYCIANGTCEQ